MARMCARRLPLAKSGEQYRDEWRALMHDKPQSAELRYATRLAWSLWEKHWKTVAPDWKPLPDLMGVLTQIDNMVANLRRPT
jgi:hypothetical protein